MKIPPEVVKASNLNFGRFCSFSSSLRFPIGREKFVCEKLEEIGLGAGGHRVISVAWVTEWNFARQSTVDALLGPEWSIMSGRAVLIGEVGLSFCIVI